MRQTFVLVFGLFLFLNVSASPPAVALCDSLEIRLGDSTLVNGDTLFVCTGTSISLTVTGGISYDWTPAGDFDDPTSPVPLLTPSASQWYFVDVRDELDNTCRDSIFAQLFDPTFEVNLSRTDTICPGDEVIATYTANGPITGITWEPEDSVFTPDNIDSTVLAPTETTEYIVTA
ncbi:MAG: hypothetical protein R3330_18400, partial [Saprospiraceae bacterium]|nr:hypothetical protein [Saprospiraceae bacterium]